LLIPCAFRSDIIICALISFVVYNGTWFGAFHDFRALNFYKLNILFSFILENSEKGFLTATCLSLIASIRQSIIKNVGEFKN
jgi:hypothetical protein